MLSPDTDTGYTFRATHLVSECEHCLYAADWAITQVMTIGTVRGVDRHKDENGSMHKAVAWRTTKG